MVPLPAFPRGPSLPAHQLPGLPTSPFAPYSTLSFKPEEISFPHI